MKALSLAVLTAVLLSGCMLGKQPDTQLYYWKGYNSSVYERLKNDSQSSAEQITVMTEYLSNAQNSNKAVAPGAYAHLGLLLLDVGEVSQAKAQFEKEKALYPESAQLMDFLLKNKNKNSKKGAK